MMIIKCKMCGGDIQISSEQPNYGTCDSCGSIMTLPKVSDERKVNLFNRANHFRRLNDFDKALNVYENILNEDDSDAEAHWGVVLSRYGIEYVEDPVSHERIPTCHRVQTDSILKDADYLAALENAPDTYSRELYEKEAERISDIQKGILAISSKEDPYDIFICYKESTDGGSRTKDSSLGQDIYYQLTNEGYKVFFARITLESMLGKEYEPYIFAALSSAKVMVVIGTKAEYLNAVWVKNEWSRFLVMMKKDRNKLLIPCYRDMDAYELPEELSMLQSQDMSKIGFLQDLIRGIKKVTENTVVKSVAEESGEIVLGVSSASLLTRAFLFLEDEDWEEADAYCERVLDMEPENARAYLGKLMVELHVPQIELLPERETTFDQEKHYKKIIRFADEGLRVAMEGYNQQIKDRLKSEDEDELKESIYSKAVNKKQWGTGEQSLLEAADLFDSISEYRNSAKLAKSCRELEAQKWMKLERKKERDQQIQPLRNEKQALIEKQYKLGIFSRKQRKEIDDKIWEINEQIYDIKRRYPDL